MALPEGQPLLNRTIGRTPARPARWAWPDPLRALTSAWSLCSVPWLAPADREALALRRFRELIAFARDRSEFYRDLYTDLPEDDLASLDRVPIVTKTMIMDNFDAVVTDPVLRRGSLESFLADPRLAGQPYAGGFAVWTSSGTSGERGIFVHDSNALAVYDALQVFRFRGALPSMDWNNAAFAMERYALVAVTGGHFAGVASVERLRSMYPWMAQRMQVFSLMQPIDVLVGQLNAYAPDIVATYPSAAALLAQQARAGNLRIAPKQFWTGGECLSESARRNLEQTFGVEVRDEYGASEFASIAVGCSAGWMHVNADWVVLEPVDERFEPVPPGVPSHTVLLTNLANRAQPLIRYDLGDSITVRPEPCPCGNPLPAIRIQGRGDDLLELHDERAGAVRLLPLVLTTVLEEGVALYDFQLLQVGPRTLRLRLGAHEHDKSLRARQALRAFLDSQGLQGTHIELDEAPPQRDGAGGKLRRILRHAVHDREHAATAHA